MREESLSLEVWFSQPLAPRTASRSEFRRQVVESLAMFFLAHPNKLWKKSTTWYSWCFDMFSLVIGNEHCEVAPHFSIVLVLPGSNFEICPKKKWSFPSYTAQPRRNHRSAMTVVQRNRWAKHAAERRCYFVPMSKCPTFVLGEGLQYVHDVYIYIYVYIQWMCIYIYIHTWCVYMNIYIYTYVYWTVLHIV